jgi:glycosyltransferase involved in cell wall biosynthesis
MVSIVTTVRNAEKTLQRTIDSVREQHIPELEYLILDAGSTDGTIDIIRANQDVITLWKSEPDRGISDGFNKGIALSRGKYVLLLNADDWLSPGQVALGIEALEQTGAGFVFGDLIYHAVSGEHTHRIRGEVNYAGRIAHIMPGLNHPTIIVRRELYERLGLFDLNFRFAMDYELLLRFHRAGCAGTYEPRMVGHMTLDGASVRNAGAALREVRDASIRHGFSVTAAWLRYAWRIFKWKSHVTLAGMPRPLYVWLRRRFNRNYVAAP